MRINKDLISFYYTMYTNAVHLIFSLIFHFNQKQNYAKQKTFFFKFTLQSFGTCSQTEVCEKHLIVFLTSWT